MPATIECKSMTHRRTHSQNCIDCGYPLPAPDIVLLILQVPSGNRRPPRSGTVTASSSRTYNLVRLARGERGPAICCESSQPAHGQDGGIVQIIGWEAGRGRARNGVRRSGASASMMRDVNRRAGLALRQPAQNVSQPVAVFKFPGLFFWRSLK